MDSAISLKTIKRLGLISVALVTGIVSAALVLAGARSAQARGQTAQLEGGAPYTVTLQIDPPVQQVGVDSVLTAIVTGQFGAPVDNGTLVTFTTDITTGLLVVETIDGRATSLISGTQAGMALVTATTPTAYGTNRVAFTAGEPATIAVVANPDALIAKSGQTSLITATVRDAYGNRVEGVALTGTLSPPTLGSVSELITTTANGEAFGTWTAGNVVVSGTLRFAYASISGAVPVALTPGDPYTVTLQATYPTRVVGNNSPLKATVVDYYGTAVRDGTEVGFATSLGDVSPLDTTSNGVAVSSISSQETGVAIITATSGSAQGATTVTFTAGTPASLELQTAPVPPVVGTYSPLTATVRDTFGNLVGSNILVTFTSSLGAVLSPRMTADGIATSSITYTLARTAYVTATTGTVSDTAVVTFVPGSAQSVTLQVSPLSPTVGTYSPLTATVRDRFGNLVGNNTSVTFTTDTNYQVVSPRMTTNGIATSTITSTVAGTANITASSGSGQAIAQVTFEPDQPYTVTLSAWPVIQTVGLGSDLRVTVTDRFNNRVAPGTSVTFTKDLPGPDIPSPRATTNGIATSRVTVTLAGTAHITAASGTVTDSTTVVFRPGTATTITVNVDPPNLVAKSGDTAVITATVIDVFDNPVPGVPLTGTVSSGRGTVGPLGQTDSSGQAFGIWTATLDSVMGSGQLSVTNGAITGTANIALLSSNVPQTVTVQVISPTLFARSGLTTTVIATVWDRLANVIPNAAVNFSLAPPELGDVTLSSLTDANGRATATWTAGSVITTGQVIADAGDASGSAAITLTMDVPHTLTLQAQNPLPLAGVGSVLTVTVSDRYGNPAARTQVTLTRSAGTVLSPVTTTNGVALSHINWTSVGTVTITATIGVAQRATAVRFVPNVPYTVSLQSKPVTPTVGAISVLTATVRDYYANLVANDTPVTFTPSMGEVSPAVGATLNGVVTSSISSTVAGAVRITATALSAQGVVTVTFLHDVPVSTTVPLSANRLVVGSGATAAFTVTVVDRYSNPVPDVLLTCYLSPTTLGELRWQASTGPDGLAPGTWTVGTVPGSGWLVCNDVRVPVTVLPRDVFLPLLMRDYPPIPSAKWVIVNSNAAATYQLTVTLQVSATVQKDYVEFMRFSNDGSNWSSWASFAPTATWNLASGNGLKTVYAQFKGHAGGISAAVSDKILLFQNGDFTQPDLANWNRDPGNALAVSGANEPGSPYNPAGLLGSPLYACNDVPIGYGSIAQNFTMPSVPAGQRLVLKLRYHIYTSDRNGGLLGNLDRFDVLLNGSVVYKDMNEDPAKPPHPDPPQAVCTVYDLTAKEVALPVTGSPGSLVNIGLRVYNLPDSIYNTYVYVDNVRLEFQSIANNLSVEPESTETPGGPRGRW